ncbi:flagellin [Clostridium sp. SHJSY1]|uniref:flagellin n=1 Tax=Clostridium sp. SHJSY1 TaxID=2942483 RepID=UPI0028765C09|nr:flagellin [Clostridium sp. SHJSY1]MDS0524183.1 flagellin [Clostridium sp. SHJSY1]
MQISWGVNALKLCNQMNIHQNKINRSIQRLSSGLRINSAADDPAGLAISERMKAQIRGLEVAKRNAEDGVSMLQTADGQLQGVQNILQRLNELSVQSANGTYSEFDRAAMSEEFNQLLDTIGGIGNNSEFNTIPLFKDKDGSGSNKFHIQVGANAGQAIEIDTGVMNVGNLGLNGVNINTPEEAEKAMTAVKNAIDKVSIQRGKIGAYENRLEYTIDNIDNYSENLTSALSRIIDVDMAKESMEYAKNSMLLEVTQALMVQVRKQEEGMVDLLKSMMDSNNRR